MKRRPLKFDVHPVVFWTTASLVLLFVVLTLSFLDQAGAAFSAVQAFCARSFGWFFVLTVNAMLLLAVALLLHPAGGTRLGGPRAKTEFSRGSWFAMLFSAGMGIGLLFYSVAEPMMHYAAPPHGPAKTMAAAQLSMFVTFFHWGLHAWGVYAVVGLALAYFHFNKGLPLTVRSALKPVLGRRADGRLGDAVDIVAAVATLFGLATSLGLGAQQINAGLGYLFGWTQGAPVQVALIAVITACATASVVLGLDAGIRRLSVMNMWLASLLLAFVFLAGPTLHLLDALVENIGLYARHLPAYAMWTEAYRGSEWQHGWTVFYWAWWIAWAPFVGMFLARISKGRTIREFLLGILCVPTLMTFVWLTVFGNTALKEEALGGGIAAAVKDDVATAIFVLLERFPAAAATCLLTVVVVATFFVTSSDSASLVVDIVTAGGNPDPPVLQRVFWAVMEGVIAAVLLVGGGLKALQTAVIAAGLPFAAAMWLVGYGLLRALDEPALTKADFPVK